LPEPFLETSIEVAGADEVCRVPPSSGDGARKDRPDRPDATGGRLSRDGDEENRRQRQGARELRPDR
jgi:hypothetical protein